MLKAVAARCFQTGYAIFPGTAFAVAPLMDAARGTESGLGLSTVALSKLPCRGRATHGMIRAGGPLDGSVPGHRERILPSRKRGYYRESTAKTPRSQDRGAQRIVCGGLEPGAPDACHYTRDHYASFYYIIE
ncbi:MAG: ribonuclease domain-containing protein [Comamonas sp.]